jgi:hypothetical protein
MDYIDLREESEKTTSSSASNNGPPPAGGHTARPPYPPYIPPKRSKAPLIIALTLGGLFVMCLVIMILNITLFTMRQVNNAYASQYWDNTLEVWNEPVWNNGFNEFTHNGIYIWHHADSGSFEIQVGELYVWHDGHSGSFTISGPDSGTSDWTRRDWIDWINNLGRGIPNWPDELMNNPEESCDDCGR